MRALLAGVTVAVCLTVAGPAFADEAEEKCVIAADRYTPMPEAHFAQLLAAAAEQPVTRCVPGYSGGADCQVDSPADAPTPGWSGFGDARDPWTPTGWAEPSPGVQRVLFGRDRTDALCDGYARDLERPPQG